MSEENDEVAFDNIENDSQVGREEKCNVHEKSHMMTRVDLKVWYRGPDGAGYGVESENVVE